MAQCADRWRTARMTAMHRMASLIFALNVLSASVAAIAQVQPGSTGGNIGRQDKSVSGGGTPEKSPPAHHPVATKSVAKSSSCGRIAGTWKWDRGAIVIIRPNGSASQSDFSGAWTCKEQSQYDLVWTTGYTDHLTLSSDGSHMDAVNNVGTHFSPTRF
jgi:hypothetical protein